MSSEDFDIASLASYLHLSPQKVTRLADRGKLPGRKIGGQWRFSRAEVHHWLEQRIGALDDDSELAHMEGVLKRAATSGSEDPTITELLPPEAISIPLAAKTRDSVIQAMVQLAASTGLLWDPDKMADAVRAREALHPTALAGGVALMHPRRPMANILSGPLLALGRTTQGIPFGGSRGQLTDIFFLICSDTDASHLRILARLGRLINDPDLMRGIRDADDAAQVRKLLVDWEEKLGD